MVHLFYSQGIVGKPLVRIYSTLLYSTVLCDLWRLEGAPSGGGGSSKNDEEEVKPVVPFWACLEMLTREETLLDYRNPATGKPGLAVKHVRFGNFPKYLLVKLSRYVALPFKVSMSRFVVSVVVVQQCFCYD